MKTQNVSNRVVKSSLQSALQRPDKVPLSEKGPYYCQKSFSLLRLQYCTFHSRNVALLLLLMTRASYSHTKILNMPAILAPYQIWAGTAMTSIPLKSYTKYVSDSVLLGSCLLQDECLVSEHPGIRGKLL